jgi:hypothetical protein
LIPLSPPNFEGRLWVYLLLCFHFFETVRRYRLNGGWIGSSHRLLISGGSMASLIIPLPFNIDLQLLHVSSDREWWISSSFTGQLDVLRSQDSDASLTVCVGCAFFCTKRFSMPFTRLLRIN